MPVFFFLFIAGWAAAQEPPPGTPPAANAHYTRWPSLHVVADKGDLAKVCGLPDGGAAMEALLKHHGAK